MTNHGQVPRDSASFKNLEMTPIALLTGKFFSGRSYGGPCEDWPLLLSKKRCYPSTSTNNPTTFFNE